MNALAKVLAIAITKPRIHLRQTRESSQLPDLAMCRCCSHRNHRHAADSQATVANVDTCFTAPRALPVSTMAKLDSVDAKNF